MTTNLRDLSTATLMDALVPNSTTLIQVQPTDEITVEWELYGDDQAEIRIDIRTSAGDFTFYDADYGDEPAIRDLVKQGRLFINPFFGNLVIA